jgi:hypothetical protein
VIQEIIEIHSGWKVFLLTMWIILAIMRFMQEEERAVKKAIEDREKINRTLYLV